MSKLCSDKARAYIYEANTNLMLVIDQFVGKIDNVLRTQALMVREIREKERELLDKVRVHRNPSSRCSLFDRAVRTANNKKFKICHKARTTKSPNIERYRTAYFE